MGAGGFVSGDLSLIRFTQVTATPQSLTQTTGNARLILGPTSSFDGDVNFNFPQLFLNGTTYNGTAILQKNGATDNTSVGNNLFNATTEIINTSNNFLRLANATADTHNANVTFTQNGNGALQPNYNTNCTYLGNVTVSSTSSQTITFGGGTGIATFTGANPQTINKTGSAANPIFSRLVMNKSSNDVTLNTRINVSVNLSLTQGLINTTQANILNMNNAATTTIGNALSYINGPMNYNMALSGLRTLNFPIGKQSDWRPAVLDARHNNVTNYNYNAEVFNANANSLGWTLPATVDTASHVHWWDIERSNTATGVATPTLHLNGNQTITLHYGANDGVTDPANLTIIKNTFTAQTTWIDIGGVGATLTSGSVSSTSAPSAFNSFSRFTLGNLVGGTNPLPIELVEFNALKNNNQVDINWVTASETNNDFFEVEKSKDGIDFEKIITLKAKGDGNSFEKQYYSTIDEKPYSGISYYRLKQIDKDKTFSYSEIKEVEFLQNGILIYPNPASDIVNIKISQNSNFSFVLYNSAGIKVMEEKNITSDFSTFNISSLSNGIYTLSTELNGEIKNIKITIIN